MTVTIDGSNINGINHVAVLTQDSDRLIAFYREVFGAQAVVEEREPGLRFTAIALGPAAMLNVFEVEGNDQAGEALPMFSRGRVDHYGLNAADVAAFERLRERLVVRGATDGHVTDFGAMRSVTFRDPDGAAVELCHWAPGTTFADLRTPDEVKHRQPVTA